MRSGKAEVVIRREDPETGLKVQCRFDLVDFKRLVWADYKTTDELLWFPKDMERLNYDRQAAWYHRILCDEMNLPFVNPKVIGYVIGSEKSLPWSGQVYRFSTEKLVEADKKNRIALNRLAEAFNDNYWPHRTGGVVMI